MALLNTALFALGAFILYKLIARLQSWRYHSQRAKALGCEDPFPYYDQGFLGYKNITRSIEADREMRLPDLILDSHQAMTDRTGRAGTFSFHVMAQSGFNTCDPRNIQAMLATQFKDYGLGDARCDSFAPLLGNGIFSTDGAPWEHSRAMLRPQFARDQVSDLNLEEKHIQNLLRAMPVGSDGWTETLNIQPLLFRMTLDSATQFLFGESADSQLAALPGYTKPKSAALHEINFADAFDDAQAELTSINRFGDYHWLIPNKRYRETSAQCHAFIDHYVQKALEPNPPKDERYVFLKELAGTTRDPLELRYQLISILLAGRDTTASTLGWLFYVLLQNPEKEKKLRAVIAENFGTYDEPRNLSFSQLKACTYLQHFIAEVLRLYPVVPLNGRRALKDTTLPTGGGVDGKSPIYVRKGQEIFYTVYVMHRRKDLWGPDADEFKPERFQGRKSGWEYLPFNGGPRICLGQQFALTNVSYATVRLLQRFDSIQGFDIPGSNERAKHGLTLTDNPGEGVKMRLRASKSSA